MSDSRKYGSSRAANIVIEDKNKCFCCQAFVPDEAVDCAECGFPQNGDGAQQRWFLGQLRVEKVARREHASYVGKSFQLLYLMPLFFSVFAIITWNAEAFWIASRSAIILAFTFLAICMYGRKDPFRAFLVSLVVYALFIIPVCIYHPSIIPKSKLYIFAPFVFLAIGLNSYRNWEKLDDKVGDKNTG